ncbi:MAG TPA: ribonuclease HI [Trueperaceae bacterium]|nr:ribonuclease HI [Trueperaceae bacterium]
MRPSNKSTTGQASLFGSADAEATAPVTTRASARAFTDGSCDTASGHGGWAYLLDAASGRSTASGYEPGTTNNRMELTAAVRALEALSEPTDVTIVTDSEYLKKAFTDGWLKKWQRNGWQTAARQPVKNRDLWEELLQLEKRHRVSWSWTRGHSGHPENEAVDALALAARRSHGRG